MSVTSSSPDESRAPADRIHEDESCDVDVAAEMVRASPSPEPSGQRRGALGDAMGRIRRGGTRLLLGSGGAHGMDLVTTALLAHHLGVEGFGLFVAARAMSGALHTFVTPRGAELVLAFVPRFQREERPDCVAALQWLALRLELLASAVCVTAAMGLGAVAPQILEVAAGQSVALVLAAACTRFGGTTVLEILLSRFKLEGAYGRTATLQVLAAFIRLTSVAVVALVGDGGLLACLLADGVGAAVATVVALRLSPTITGEPTRAPAGSLRPLSRELFAFARTNWFATTVKGLNVHAPELLLEAFASATEVGLFGLARKLGPSAMTLAMRPLTQSVSPELYRLVQIDRTVVKAFALRVSGYSVVALSVLGSGLIVFRDPLLLLGGGEAFVAAAEPFVVLVLAYSIQLTFYWLRPLLLALQRPGLILVANGVFAATMAIGALLLIEPLGALGAAWAVLAAPVLHVIVLLIAGGLLLHPLRVSRRPEQEGRSGLDQPSK